MGFANAGFYAAENFSWDHKAPTLEAQVLLPIADEIELGNTLEDIVEKIILCLNSIKTPNNNSPLFNGASEFKINDFYNYLAGLDYKLISKKRTIGQICILGHHVVTIT